MFFDPEKNEVIDFVGGRRGPRQENHSSIGDPAARFSEYRLRMLRAVRFATVSITRSTRNVDGVAGERRVDHEISAERIREEL